VTAAVLAACTTLYGGREETVTIGPVSLTLPDRGYLSIVGKSGSGKTTVLSILGALSRPTTGTATIGGVNTSGASARRLSRLRKAHIGFVFQQFHLLERRTALDNVLLAFGPPPIQPSTEHMDRATAALAAVGLQDRASVTAAALSGGEQQRVGIARALVKRPALLLCDEPTGNLDSDSSAQVVELIEEALDYAAVVVVTHDRELGRRASDQLDLDKHVASH